MIKSQIQPSTKIEKEIMVFLSTTMLSIAEYHTIDLELLTKRIVPTFISADDEHYGEKIREIDPNAEYTNDENFKGMGKTIHKNDKNYAIINSQVFGTLIHSGYKNIESRYVLYHELGHCVNYAINPELHPREKPLYSISLREGSEYLYSVAIDEYMANNYITFLLTSDDCKALLNGNTLYKDIENLYINICDSFDLFNRLWNGPNAIFLNLIKHIPLFEKNGGIKETEELEILNIKSIITVLKKSQRQFDIVYNHLVKLFNSIVTDYNSDNPDVFQKIIQ